MVVDSSTSSLVNVVSVVSQVSLSLVKIVYNIDY